MRTKLTQTVAEELEPRGRAYVVYDAGVPGFGVRDYRRRRRALGRLSIGQAVAGGARATRRLTIGRVSMPCPTPRRARPPRHSITAPASARIRPGFEMAKRAAPTVDNGHRALHARGDWPGA